MSNVYYSPGKYGLEIVGEVEKNEPNWSFDTIVVFRDGEQFYIGADSGCSCPTPFDGMTRDDLQGPLSAEGAVALVEAEYEGYDRARFDELIDAIRSY